MSVKPVALSDDDLIAIVAGLGDVNFTDAELDADVQSHTIGKDQIGEQFSKFMDNLPDPKNPRLSIICIARCIYQNGLHDAIPDGIKVGPLTYKAIRTAQRKSGCSKANLLRSLAGTVAKVHALNDKGAVRNIFIESSERFGLDISKIPDTFRFFGALHLPGLAGEARKAYLAVQNEIFRLSAERVNTRSKLGFSEEPLSQDQVQNRNREYLSHLAELRKARAGQ